MLLQDCHLHSSFSFDSDQSLEEYLLHSNGLVVTTEHFDLSNPYTGSDDIPDAEAYFREVDRLNKQYHYRLRKGIEIGYYEPREADILAYLNGKAYDLKLLSIHHNGRYDYLQSDVFDEPWQDVLTDYLSRLEYAIGRVDADVLAHFDYGFRKLGLTVNQLSQFEEQLKAIFQKMVHYNLAFELNTKSLFSYGNEALYVYALGLLNDIEGVTYTIGSDGHHLAHYRLDFDRLEDWLDRLGFDRNHLMILS
ncbi:PHP domain-containing protein [Streptococcus fryi]